MTDFNNQWIEIFRVGDYGAKGKYTQQDLEKMVANFPVWKPPLVIGRPDTNSPAMGWAAELKAENGKLFARAEKVQPELEQHVASGRFPNRSIAIYVDPKGSGPAVRHIGFLGATPPEVKGLAPIQFSDGEFVAIEFDENKEDEMDPKEVKKTVMESIREFFAELGGKKPEATAFSEEQMAAKLADMKKEMEGKMAEAVAAVKKEFAEAANKAKETIEAGAKTAAVEKVKAFIAARVAANQWVPAFAEAKLDRVLEVLATGEAVTFSEGDGDKKKDVTFGEAEAYAALTSFLEKLPKIVPMGDLAGEAHRQHSNVTEMKFNETRDLKVDPESLALNAQAEAIAAELRTQDPKLNELDAFKEGMARARTGAAVKAGGIAAGKA